MTAGSWSGKRHRNQRQQHSAVPARSAGRVACDVGRRDGGSLAHRIERRLVCRQSVLTRLDAIKDKSSLRVALGFTNHDASARFYIGSSLAFCSGSSVRSSLMNEISFLGFGLTSPTHLDVRLTTYTRGPLASPKVVERRTQFHSVFMRVS